jgi:acetyl-CoA synthetase
MYIFQPPKELAENSNVHNHMIKKGFRSYKELVNYSTEKIESFWKETLEILDIELFKNYSKILDTSKGIEWSKWFVDATTNITFNCIDKHIKAGKGSKIAFVWHGENGEKKAYTYYELYEEVNRLAGFLKETGIKKGDIVAAYMPMLPETIVTMFATFKIGGIFAPIFSGFAPFAVSERIKDAQPKILVTCNGYYRKGRIIKLIDQANEALKISNSDSKKIIVERIKNLDYEIGKDDLLYSKIIKDASKYYGCEELSTEDPAMLLYTSGTTGKPKAAVIPQIGAMIQPGKEHFFNLDMKEDSRMLWITDIGWMMGPWQIIGSQLLCSSHVIFEGAIDYPSNDRIWKIIEEDKVTNFGFAATVARILKSYGLEPIKNHNIESLKYFGNTGEPIDPDTWMWIVKDVGEEKRPMINLSGGTELFGCFLLPSPVVSLKPSTLWGPGLGMDVDVFDDEGKSVREKIGYLVCKKPFPSMTRGFWKDPERYIASYWSRFKGVWYHGDLAYIDADGYWFILGRADDTIKVAGKRIGPAEIEAIINKHRSVAESACIGIPDKIKGEEIVSFVALKPGNFPSESIEKEILVLVEKELGKAFVPKKIIFVKELPRNRAGKILRRLIRDLIYEREIKDVSIVENPESLEEIKSKKNAIVS